MADIFNAIRNHDQESLDEYLRMGGDIDARDSNGMTALIRAVDEGCDSIVKFLLARSASPDLTDRWGQTGLMLAAGRNNTECVKLLLARGAALNIRAKNGLTALQFATENGATEAARALAEAGTRPTQRYRKIKTAKGG